jgi:cobalt-zinc-cadmium efflux system outer membrane protein
MNWNALRIACGLLALASTAFATHQSNAEPVAQRSGMLTLPQALQRALAANPKLTAAERELGIATGRRIQAGAIPNPELSFELDDAFGTKEYRGTERAETTLQLSQLIELGGKRDARVRAGLAEIDSASWQGQAIRLEVLSETATAFVNVLSGQRRVQILSDQVSALDRLTPLLQRRVEAGASSPAEISRAQVAVDLIRVERERAKTSLATARRELAVLMGDRVPNFASVSGQFSNIGRPPSFQTVLAAIDSNPQLMRWTAVRAQREAELLTARLKPMPDVRVGVGWRHYRETNDNAVRLGISIPLPVWDQNRGDIISAEQSLQKAQAERDVNRAALISVAGRSYDVATGALAELALLRSSVIPNSRKAAEGIQGGYTQGRFSLLEVLDAQAQVGQAALREQEALQSFHTAVTKIEGLVGRPFVLTQARRR